MLKRKAIIAAFFIALTQGAVADGISGGIGAARAIGLLILVVVVAAVVLTIAVYVILRSKIVFLLFPFYVAIGLGSLYSLQFFLVWKVSLSSFIAFILVTTVFVSLAKSGR